MISVLIPTLNPGPRLGAVLAALVPGAVEGVIKEVVAADAGSADGTLSLLDEAGCRVIASERGRGVQLRAAAQAARGEWLLALHADTVPGEGWIAAVERHMAQHPDKAGYFRLRFDERSAAAGVWEAGVALRNRALALPYGDQGLLVRRDLYEAVGGYPDWPLMEDVDLVRRLGRRRLRALDAHAVTSAERYRRHGWARRTAGNWSLLARWALGADPRELARRYG